MTATQDISHLYRNLPLTKGDRYVRVSEFVKTHPVSHAALRSAILRGKLRGYATPPTGPAKVQGHTWFVSEKEAEEYSRSLEAKRLVQKQNNEAKKRKQAAARAEKVSEQALPSLTQLAEAALAHEGRVIYDADDLSKALTAGYQKGKSGALLLSAGMFFSGGAFFYLVGLLVR